MTQLEHKTSFNQGVDAAASSLEKYRQVPKKDETLTNTSLTFNRLLDEFQAHIKEEKKVV